MLTAEEIDLFLQDPKHNFWMIDDESLELWCDEWYEETNL